LKIEPPGADGLLKTKGLLRRFLYADISLSASRPRGDKRAALCAYRTVLRMHADPALPAKPEHRTLQLTVFPGRKSQREARIADARAARDLAQYAKDRKRPLHGPEAGLMHER